MCDLVHFLHKTSQWHWPPKCDTNDGCKKPSNITKFYDRTAGIIALLRSCGIVINWTEMYTYESLTQVYLSFISHLDVRSDIKRLRYLGYDRVAVYTPFLVNLSKKNIMFAKYFLEHVRFLVTDSMSPSTLKNAACHFTAIPSVNTTRTLKSLKTLTMLILECAEQAFRWLNKLKYSVRQMSRYRFNFFLHDAYQYS